MLNKLGQIIISLVKVVKRQNFSWRLDLWVHLW